MMTFGKGVALFLVGFLGAGCVHYTPRVHDRFPTTLNEEVRNHFQYPHRPIHSQVKILKETKKYVLKEVTFELHLPDNLSERPVGEIKKEVEEKRRNDDEKGAQALELEYTVRLDYYQVKGEERKPVILVAPILGGNMIVDWFASFFASHGMHAAIIHRRKPKYDSSRSLDQVEKYLEASVIRTRQALDWLLDQPEIDQNRVGSFGISYGGIVNTLAAAVEPRIQCHILAMAGGPLADVIVDSKEKAIRKYVRKAAKEAGYTPETLRADLRRAIHSDTLTLAPYVDSKKVLFVIAFFDRVVGRKYSSNLWRALGKPEVIFTPLGHYGTILMLPYLKSKALHFYRSQFYRINPGTT